MKNITLSILLIICIILLLTIGNAPAADSNTKTDTRIDITKLSRSQLETVTYELMDRLERSIKDREEYQKQFEDAKKLTIKLIDSNQEILGQTLIQLKDTIKSADSLNTIIESQKKINNSLLTLLKRYRTEEPKNFIYTKDKITFTLVDRQIIIKQKYKPRISLYPLIGYDFTQRFIFGGELDFRVFADLNVSIGGIGRITLTNPTFDGLLFIGLKYKFDF